MWARIMKERFQARNERSMMLRFHVQTAGSTLTAQQPLNNVVRTAYQALAAVLGGTQSLHTNSYDEALGLPTEAAARLAVRTQQVLAHESGVAEFIDPLAGSYCVESLTNELERQAEDYLARIDALGGMLRAIEIGFVQKEIENAAYADQRRVESGERIVVGVNRFQADESAATPAQKIEPQREQEQIARLRQWRAARDAARVQNALAAIQETAAGTGNVMPPILAAVEAGATTGEIADALRRQFGEFQETITI